MSEARDARALERSYNRRVQVAILAAIAIHGAAIVVVPPYVPRPYKLDQHPLRLVNAGFRGAGAMGMGAPTSAPAAPAGRAGASAAPAPFAFRSRAIVTEQVPVSPAGPAASAGPEARSMDERGAAWGAGDEAPPVFYEFDSPPTVIRKVVPEYPAMAKLQEAEGTVVLDANVDERGRVIRVWVARATASEALIQAAVDAMYRFQFSPGSQQGVPVKCTVAVPFNFRLNLHL